MDSIINMFNASFTFNETRLKKKKKHGKTGTENWNTFNMFCGSVALNLQST